MKDSYGRTIEYLRISVTDRCNLRCLHCMPEEGVTLMQHADILSYEEIAAVVTEAAKLGIRRIRLTGGEPLVRPQLHKLVALLKSIPGIEAVVLTTNAVLLKEQLPALREAGLDGVNVSLNAMDREAYLAFTGRDEFDRAMEGLHAALDCPDLKVKVNCVPIAGREEQLLKLAAIARDTRAAVRFIELMPIGMGSRVKGIAKEELLKLLSDAFRQDVLPGTEVRPSGSCRQGTPRHPLADARGDGTPLAPPLQADYQIKGPAEYIRFSGFQSDIGFISAISSCFCEKCNRIRLTADGKLKSCLAFPAGEDVRTILRNGADPQALREALIRCIESKPEHHFFGSSETEEARLMSQIGG